MRMLVGEDIIFMVENNKKKFKETIEKLTKFWPGVSYQHVPSIFVTSSTYGRTFLKVDFSRRQTPSKINIFRNSKFQRNLNEVYNTLMSFKYQIFQFLMVIGLTKNYHSISLSLAVYKYINLIAFGTWMLSANKVHYVSFESFQFKNVPIQNE